MKNTGLAKSSAAIFGLCLLLMSTGTASETENTGKPWPGKQGSFHSFAQYSLQIENIGCKVVVPDKIADGKPWIWRARFFGHEPQTDIALLKRGFHVVYVEVGGLYGSPEAVARWDKLYKYFTESHGFAKKTVLEGMSRGGLIIFNWADKNPEKVYCIYADAPVCDFKSWPGINDAIMKAYGLTKKEAQEYKGNPIDNLKPLADAGVPLLHVVGDADKVVPVAENTAIIEKRYKELGGLITVIHKEGVGHHPHSLKDPKPIVDFILKYTQISSPQETILFLGDSITQAGGYVRTIDEALKKKFPENPPLVINRGKSSETVSGLSEAYHPGVRPSLFARLDNELEIAKPDWVVACYGINCGIYHPFDEKRFAAYKAGIEKLIEKVHVSGSHMVLFTAPPYARSGPAFPEGTDPAEREKLIAKANKEANAEADNNPKKYGYRSPYAYYDHVMEHYATWLETLNDRDDVWVINLRKTMLPKLKESYGGDPIHPNSTGHNIMATTFLEQWPGIKKEAGLPVSKKTPKVVFEDKFEEKLGEGWIWIRENKEAMRISEGALEIKVEPGVANTVKNALVREAPDRGKGKVTVEITISNQTLPTRQYEQAGITWYSNGKPVFKLVKEFINGKLYIIPGKIPMDSKTVQLRLIAGEKAFEAQFRPDGKGEFKKAASGRLPPPNKDQVSIQCYNGPPDAAHWIRFDDFRLMQEAK